MLGNYNKQEPRQDKTMTQRSPTTPWIRDIRISPLTTSKGQALVEYVLILMVLAVAVTVALTPIGGAVADVFVEIDGALAGQNSPEEDPPKAGKPEPEKPVPEPPDNPKPGNPEPGPPNDPKPGKPDPGPPNDPKPGNPKPGPKNEVTGGQITRSRTGESEAIGSE